jgi:hypothetical protein
MDQFISKMRDEYEVHNYLKYNEKPHYLQKKNMDGSTFYRHYSKPDEKMPLCFDIMPSNLSEIEETIKKCDKLQNILSNKNIVSDNECPVCYTEFGSTNYIVPKCGHKVCISCFTNNARQNRENANTCSLCRGDVLHT